MASASRIDSARWAGLLAGLGLVVAAFVAWQMPASGHALGADVTVIATPHGELVAAPLSPTLAARGLTPGDARHHSLTLTNITGVPLSVRFRALPSNSDLDRMVELTLSDNGRTVAAGTLASLRQWTAPVLRLPVRAVRRLMLTVRLLKPSEQAGMGARAQTAGMVVEVPLEISAAGEKP